MKTFADLKRKLQVGVTVTMLKHDWFPAGELIGKPRKIKLAQSNGIQFEPHKEGSQGSWLYFFKAKDYRFPAENVFEVTLTPDNGFGKVIQYQIMEVLP